VFEVDHPATQALKMNRLKNVIDPLPDHVIFIPIDFNTQTPEERLHANGYDEPGKTLFIWQGVTGYLTPEGIDSTLTSIANHSGPGSAVIFDYFTNEALHGPEVKKIRLLMRAIGEEIIFGIDEDQIEPFLTQLGLLRCS
jgi:methyltransferase (TIGR00027 family)